LILEPRAGSIDQAWVEPSSPTEATPVTLKASLTEPLRLASFDVRQISTMLTVRLYWTTAGGNWPWWSWGDWPGIGDWTGSYRGLP
jgi:hypothetical protein